ncbi:MAG: GNAT family N-acetyltransferase [Saprospiraceae bacterium]|nr:GNAT family N-acetyltransferase [Saprospiraceae bacterium]
MIYIATGKRIDLRVLTVEDADWFFELNEDPQVLLYTGDHPFKSREESKRFLAAYNQYSLYKMGRCAIIRKSDSKVLGWCGLKYHDADNYVELGFRLFRKYWGQGYATEAAKLSIDYAFHQLNLHELIGRVDERNLGSIRVLEKSGMTLHSSISTTGSTLLIYKLTNPN